VELGSASHADALKQLYEVSPNWIVSSKITALLKLNSIE
jgi:hypothetical protein